MRLDQTWELYIEWWFLLFSQYIIGEVWILLEEGMYTVLGVSLKPLNGVSISFLDAFLVLD